MVTAKTQYNLKNAREYFEEHLCVGDYYQEGHQVAGAEFGHGLDAARKTHDVAQQQFQARPVARLDPHALVLLEPGNAFYARGWVLS